MVLSGAEATHRVSTSFRRELWFRTFLNSIEKSKLSREGIQQQVILSTGWWTGFTQIRTGVLYGTRWAYKRYRLCAQIVMRSTQQVPICQRSSSNRRDWEEEARKSYMSRPQPSFADRYHLFLTEPFTVACCCRGTSTSHSLVGDDLLGPGLRHFWGRGGNEIQAEPAYAPLQSFRREASAYTGAMVKTLIIQGLYRTFFQRLLGIVQGGLTMAHMTRGIFL